MNNLELKMPVGWAVVPLSEVAEVRLGRQRSPEKAHGPNMRPYLRAANVKWSGISLDDVKEMQFSPDEVETYKLRPGDIILNEASGSVDEVGKPGIWGGEIDECCIQNTLLRVRPGAAVQTKYLYYHFLWDARRKAFAAHARGTGIHHLGADGLSKWSILVPAVTEQRRIASKIEALLSGSQCAANVLNAVPPLLDRTYSP